MTFDYDSWLKTARDRLEELYRQKVAVEDEIEKLQRGIQSFAPLSREATNAVRLSGGMTESIRELLKASPSALFSPTEIRNSLLASGVKLGQKNPMATIHQVLGRLIQNEDVQMYPLDGKNRYRWIGKSEQVKKSGKDRK